ncbi:hypothetical protein [Streptomyces spectabilis]|uniref:Uncharacterized protein n=1 Tax=Streptomyces spectabilis TaxID=68270 RepID=A0A5P2X480_STRST|nr:hypothetical protein [Streptomyces spectabilis]MCI3900381.1 hypothetical protein [Streptomyces spectabilis]QEV57965.1 hypothetical protein CP982_03940 [Streptomyces spectabilis]
MTKGRLGPRVIADLKAGLWPVDCQSCGRPLGRWPAAALEVVAEEGDGFAVASLHHPRCRRPAWQDGQPGASVERPLLSWRAGCTLLPPSGLPTFLVNPSYECALLRRADDTGWRVATLEPFVALGLALDFPSRRPPVVPALSAALDGDRISVDVRHEGGVLHAWHDVPIGADVADAVRASGDVLVAVTTLLDVSKPFPLDVLLALLGARRVALGPARLTSVRRSGTDRALRADDFSADVRRRSFALAYGLLSLSRPPRDAVVAAALALCEGDEAPVRELRGHAKLTALFLVSHLYALGSRDAARAVRRGGGVHVIAPDAVRAKEYADFFAALLEGARTMTVARLGAEPLSAEGGAAYLADIVIGTGEEFAACCAAYREAGPEFALHAGRGRLALLVEGSGTDPGPEALTRRYPRLAVV